MLNALTLLFFCQLVGEVVVQPARHHLPRAGPRHGAAVRRAARRRPLGRGARRRRRHHPAEPVAALRPGGGRGDAAGGADRRQLGRDLRGAGALDGRDARRHGLHLPRRVAAGRAEAGDERAGALSHLGLSLRDAAPLADGDARGLRGRRRDLGPARPASAGQPGDDRGGAAHPAAHRHRHRLRHLLRGGAVRALPARPGHRRARAAALAQPGRGGAQPPADVRGARRRVDHRDRLGGARRLGARRAGRDHGLARRRSR